MCIRDRYRSQTISNLSTCWSWDVTYGTKTSAWNVFAVPGRSMLMMQAPSRMLTCTLGAERSSFTGTMFSRQSINTWFQLSGQPSDTEMVDRPGFRAKKHVQVTMACLGGNVQPGEERTVILQGWHLYSVAVSLTSLWLVGGWKNGGCSAWWDLW